jgi:hypothetical protein
MERHDEDENDDVHSTLISTPLVPPEGLLSPSPLSPLLLSSFRNNNDLHNHNNNYSTCYDSIQTSTTTRATTRATTTTTQLTNVPTNQHLSNSIHDEPSHSTTPTPTTSTTNKNNCSTLPRFNRLNVRSWSILSPDEDVTVRSTTTTTTIAAAIAIPLPTPTRYNSTDSYSTTTSTTSTTATTTTSKTTTTGTPVVDSTQSIILTQYIKPMIYYLIYAIVNVIISVPGLYGYTAIIFNHTIFLNHRNALSKLVIFSSLIHQLAFTSCSTISTFAIGTVQDAGLIFLATMSNTLTNTIIQEYHVDTTTSNDSNTEINSINDRTEQVVLSTVLVLLSFGTATLGLVLIIMGHFRLAEYVLALPHAFLAKVLLNDCASVSV